jgi:ribosomal protein S18 acetylase RimI-like enzyme
MSVAVRPALESEIDQLGTVWYDAWQDAHAAIVPAELTRLRTLESFRQRIHDALPSVRVVGPPNAPLGFCMIKDDELYQLFVAAGARGTGTATALLADGESRLAASGVSTAFLACAIGNDRAARFYEKHGWTRVGTMANRLDTPNGEFLLDVWRYEKAVR